MKACLAARRAGQAHERIAAMALTAGVAHGAAIPHLNKIGAQLAADLAFDRPGLAAAVGHLQQDVTLLHRVLDAVVVRELVIEGVLQGPGPVRPEHPLESKAIEDRVRQGGLSGAVVGAQDVEAVGKRDIGPVLPLGCHGDDLQALYPQAHGWPRSSCSAMLNGIGLGRAAKVSRSCT
jgi:hypothetical protein